MVDQFVTIKADGLGEMIDGLRSAQRDLRREQRRANRDVAVQAQQWARSAASRGTRQQQAMAGAIQARASATMAKLALSTAGKWGAANPAFWGQTRKFGWYGGWYRGERVKRRTAGFADGPPQGPKWVGSNWIGGVKGEGPYVLNDALADHIEEIGDLYLDAYERALKAAFPGGAD